MEITERTVGVTKQGKYTWEVLASILGFSVGCWPEYFTMDGVRLYKSFVSVRHNTVQFVTYCSKPQPGEVMAIVKVIND